MAFFLKLSFLAILFASSRAQQRQSNISLGSSLAPNAQNSSWLSNSGLYAFGFYNQGDGFFVGVFLAGIPQRTVVWTANRDSSPATSNATLLFTSEGRLVLQSEKGQEYIIGDSGPASSASMLNSGNFVLYNSAGEILWQSFDHPTDTLLPTQLLLTGKELISSISESEHSTGIFRLKMQTDGNLVQYPVGTPDEAPHSYFTSWTDGKGSNVTLVFDVNGQLYLRNSTGLNMKNITADGFPRKSSSIFLMRIDSDGIFRIYSHSFDQNGSWEILWSSSSDKCEPKGLCGLNAFCVPNGQEAACRCIPGFDFVDREIRASGCRRNFTADTCGNERVSFIHTIEELPNTVWLEDSYAIIPLPNKESCNQACYDDCNCEVAFFKDDKCMKQKLPLRYGRGLLTDGNTALVKVFAPKPSVPSVPTDTEGQGFQRRILITSAMLFAFGSIMVMISIFLLHRSKFWRYKKLTTGSDEVQLAGEVGLQAYTYEDLQEMTDNFKEEIGRGSFGTVYKGRILNGQKLIAVKRLTRLMEEGDVEFQNEMRAIGRIHHKNLVRLLGYCREGLNRLLVYEYMANGSLADFLFGRENQPCWNERVEITCGIARGILYLHEECEAPMIHCDIKPQNILIDNDGCAKISDFGLTKLLMPDQTRTFTNIRGTKGYVAPEWFKKLPVTIKADIYSFGVVLLEIICCRRNVNVDLSEEEAILEEWAYECFENGGLRKLVRDEDVDKTQLERMVSVALWCIQEEPSLRPSMKNVLLMLEGFLEIPTPPSRNSFS